MSLFGAIRWMSNPVMPEGKVALYRNGKLIWYGDLSAPFDDADMDEMHLNPKDWDDLKKAIEAKENQK